MNERSVRPGPISLPPLTITADLPATTDTSVTINWDPGLVTDRIDSFKVYWDTDTGGSTAYGFDSDNNPGQVAFNGNEATISGLTAGTDHFITVTSVSTLTNPSSGVMTTYESSLFPTQLSGDPSFVYPVEVMATTTGGVVCDPPATTGLTAGSLGGDGAQLCWEASAEACVTDHQVARGTDGELAGGCATVTTTSNCVDDNTPLSAGTIQFFLARPFLPTAGSWGQSSALVERTLPCAP